ncbi:type IV pilus modification PilV family protein [Geminocystis sp. CENA526]
MINISPPPIDRGKSLHQQSLTLKDTKEEGFSILEVLVTILVISGFLLGSLQATVLSVLLRVQAQDKQEAANWIQQDLELIRYQAFILPTVPTNCGTYGANLQTTLTTGGQTNQGSGVQINGKWYRVFRVYTHNNSNILTINYTLAYAPAVNPNPAHPRYRANASYTPTGTTPPDSTNPNVVTTLSTEVIPNAALSC